MLNPATIALIVQGIQAAIAAAPQVEKVAKSAKNWVASLFEGGLISKETQDAIHDHVDLVTQAALSNSLPPEWSVEPDPAP